MYQMNVLIVIYQNISGRWGLFERSKYSMLYFIKLFKYNANRSSSFSITTNIKRLQ